MPATLETELTRAVQGIGWLVVDNDSHLQCNRGMYVCICNGITDRDIREAAQRGASDLTALRMATGCATQCGSCADEAQAILDEQLRAPHFARSRVVHLRIVSAA